MFTNLSLFFCRLEDTKIPFWNYLTFLESENRDQAVAAFEQMTVTGGAVSKFKKKEKKKKKKNNFWNILL